MALWAVAALCVGACDRGAGNAAQRSQCARFCELLEKCDDETDLEDCEDHCNADEVHSDNYFRARADCGEKLSCNLWVDEVDTQGDPDCTGDCDLVECVDNALAKVKLNADEQQACTSTSTKINACDPSYAAATTERSCERTTPLLSKAYLEESQLCIERECGQINSCLDDLADEYETDLRLFSGKLQPR